MAWVDGANLVLRELLHAGCCRCAVVHDRVERRPLGVLQQVAADQVAAGQQDADGAQAVAGQVDDLRVQAMPSSAATRKQLTLPIRMGKGRVMVLIG